MTTMVNDKKSLVKILIGNRDRIKSYGVSTLGIFGSFASDQARKESDIDFLVEFKSGQKNYRNFINLQYLLEEITGRKVELVTLMSISPYLKDEILKEVEYAQI